MNSPHSTQHHQGCKPMPASHMPQTASRITQIAMRMSKIEKKVANQCRLPIVHITHRTRISSVDFAEGKRMPVTKIHREDALRRSITKIHYEDPLRRPITNIGYEDPRRYSDSALPRQESGVDIEPHMRIPHPGDGVPMLTPDAHA